MSGWFLRRRRPHIWSAAGQTTLARPELIDQIKADMLGGRFRYESPEGRIAGWRDAGENYYINEGHHRVNAALEIERETGDRLPLDLLLTHGLWEETAPPARHRLPTRSWWSRMLYRLGM